MAELTAVWSARARVGGGACCSTLANPVSFTHRTRHIYPKRRRQSYPYPYLDPYHDSYNDPYTPTPTPRDPYPDPAN